MKASNLAVLALLRARGDHGVTALDALDAVGSFRLGARIHELKADGIAIVTALETTPSGKRIARYRLAPHESPVQLTLLDSQRGALPPASRWAPSGVRSVASRSA
jgi:hypothetical protein